MTNVSMKAMTKRAVDDVLTQLFTANMAEAGTIHPRYKRLWAVVQSLVSHGGKRYRSYLTMIGHGAFSDQVVPIAAAQELVHYAMLMHDDIIDQDTLRRGVKNATGVYLEEYASFLSPALARHYAYGAGLIAGDALISEAYHMIMNSSYDDQTKTKLANQLHRSIFEVVDGELMDVEAGFVSNVEYDPMQIYRYKTAGYSFIGPLLSGAICSGVSEATLAVLEQVGAKLGIGYQLQDDILGITSTEAELGKTVLLDIREAKNTYIVAQHQKRMNNEQRQRFGQVFGNDSATEEQLLAVRDDMIASGATEQAGQAAINYFDNARQLVATLDNAAQQAELGRLIDELSERKY